MGADFHDVVGLVSPSPRPRIERPGHVAARSSKYRWRAGWVAIRKRSADPIERSGGNHGRAAAVRRLRPRGERALA